MATSRLRQEFARAKARMSTVPAYARPVVAKSVKPSGLWAEDEARDFLNTRYHLDKMDPKVVDEMIADLRAMRHRPHCRTNMSSIAPNYGSECTCDSAEKIGSPSTGADAGV